jgi:hypothetical protein
MMDTEEELKLVDEGIKAKGDSSLFDFRVGLFGSQLSVLVEYSDHLFLVTMFHK